MTGVHGSTAVPSTVTGADAPVTQTVVVVSKRSAGPDMVVSRPAAPASFPTARLARRKDRSSIGPDGGTPTCQYPVRPGQSCTVVSTPGRSTVILTVTVPPPVT